MSNLANQYLDAGLIDEARAECDEAIKQKSHHKNVESSLIRIKELPEEETLKIGELDEKSKIKSDFLRLFGSALCCSNSKKFIGDWDHPKCLLKVELEGDIFSAAGTYEQTSNNSISNALMGTPNIFGASTPVKRVTINLSGRLHGCAVNSVLKFDTGEGSRPATLLGAAMNELKALIYLSDDQNELHVMENPHFSEPNIYTMARVSHLSN